MGNDHIDAVGGSATDGCTGPETLQILIVTTDLVAGRVAAGLLQSKGHRVTTATEVDYRSEIPDTVVLDLTASDDERLAIVTALRQWAAVHRKPLHLVLVGNATSALSSLRGGDCCLAKPLQPSELFDAVIPSAANDTIGLPSESETMPFDWQSAVDQLESREDLLLELAEAFLDECETLMQHIETAFANDDQVGLQRAAHTLKGSANLFQANPTAAAARQLETLAKDGRWDDARRTWSELQTHVQQLLPALRSHIGKG